MLLVIQYLRKLGVSLNEIKKVIEGNLSFSECLVNQQKIITTKVQDLQKLQKHIKIMQDKQLSDGEYRKRK